MVHSTNPFQPCDALTVVRADIRDRGGVSRAVAGVRAVVHLAAAKADERTSHDVNVGGAEAIIEACRSNGCRRVVNVSTQSTKIVRRGVYGHTKAEADARFRDSGLDVTTLLLSIVYSDDLQGIFGTLFRIVERSPIVPVFGDGTWISAPIDADDVAAAVAACLATDIAIGRTYDLCGPDQVTFDELLRAIGRSIGRTPRLVHVPYTMSMLIARIGAALLPRPPITVSNVLGSNQQIVVDTEAPRRDFGFAPIDLHTGMSHAARRLADRDQP
jgi:NADH dehydrogenase